MLRDDDGGSVLGVLLPGLLASLVFLSGCGDDEAGRGGSNSGSQTPAWLPAQVEPLEADSGAPGAATWFRRSGDAREPALFPAELSAAPVVLSRRLAPSPETVHVEAGDATLVLPGGLIQEPGQLVLRRAVSPVGPPIEGVTPVATWGVEIDGRTVFDQPLQLRVKVDEALVARAGDLPHPLAACYYHPQAKAWVSTRIGYDATTGTATIRTRHLTFFTIILRPLNNWFHHAVYTDHFAIFYSPIDLAHDTEVNNQRWVDHLAADLDKHGEPVGQARKIDEESFEVYGQDDVPLYVLYLAKALEYAWGRYDDLGFPAPRHTRTDIYVGVNSPFSDSSHRGKLLGAIAISPTSDWRPVTARIATAHEFFHAVQAEYLGLAIMSMNYRTWWLEALAEYAPRTVWGETVYIRPMAGDYFKQPLVTQDDRHEYATAHLVSFLTGRKRIALKDLVDETLTVPAGILAMEEASAPDFAVLKGLLGIDGPFDDYTAAVTYGMLDRMLHRRDTSIDDVYAEFLAYVLFDGNCNSLVTSGWDLLRFARGYFPIAGLALNDRSIEQTLATLPYGTASVWAAKVENPIPADGEPAGAARRVEVALGEPLPARTRVDLYVLAGNERLAGGVKPVATLRGDKTESTVAVGAPDVLYVALINTSHEPASVEVRVTSRMDLRIVPASVERAGSNEELSFEAVLTGLPEDIAAGSLEVRWTPVAGAAARRPVHPRGAGAVSTFEYAWPHKGTYELKAELMQQGEVIAEARAPVAIEADEAPSVTLEARRIIVTAGRAFEVTCTTRNVGLGATYRWKIGHDSVSTDAPVVSHTIALAGDHAIEVDVFSADGKFLAGDKATLSVEAGEDLVWIEDIDIRDGQRVVLRKYQVFRGTHTRHGLYLDWHTTQEEGQLEVRKTFDHDVCIKSETFYEDGAPRVLEHFDKDGRRHGECAYYLADGRRAMLVNYVHGKKSGPYEKTIYGKTTFTRTSGRYTNDLAEGRWSVHTGNWKTGKEYLKSTTEMSGGKRNGLHVSYLPDGRKSAESHYRNDKRHGVARSWYTWEVDDGIYYKMNERDYEDGKLIRERKYRSNGELLWEKQR